MSIRIYIPNLPRQQAKTIVGPTLFALLFSGIIVLHFWWLDLKNHFFLFFMVVVLSNGRINLFPFTFFFSFPETKFPKVSFFCFSNDMYFNGTDHMALFQDTSDLHRNPPIGFCHNSFCHTHRITTEPPVLYRSIGSVLALQPASAEGCFPLVSLKADSLPCHLIIWLEHYSKLWGKLLPPPEETYQEFPFFLSGGKFEIWSMIWLLFGGNFSVFPND